MNGKPSIHIHHFDREDLTLDLTPTLEPLVEVIVRYIGLHYHAEFNDRLNALEEGYPLAIRERLDELFKPLLDRLKHLEERVQQLERQADFQESYELEMRDRES